MRLIHNTRKYTGTSFEAKPTGVGAGSTLWEYDTRIMYITYDGTNWVVKSAETWIFGEPTLHASHNGNAVWSRAEDTETTAAYQKGNTGWVANLYGGLQTGGESYGALYIPVNEMPVPDLTSAMWTYNFSGAQTFGINLVVWIHDPTDFDKRAEVTQSGSSAFLEKASGWNAHELDTSNADLLFYGEGTSGEGLTAPFSWAEVQADVLFSTWTIYRISLEDGWYTTGTFGDAWLADVSINGEKIPLKPDSSGTGRIGHRFFTDTSGAISTIETLKPRTPFRLLSVMLHLNSAATQESFTLTCNAARSSAYDTLLYSVSMSGVSDVIKIFGEGYDFYSDDVIDPVWTNSDGRIYGITYTYQTVFEGA